MKSFYVAVIICMLGVTQAFAQSIINGKVTDMEKNPLEYVTVALYDANTRALQQGTITNRSGIFSLEKVKPGKYYLTLTMIGFVKTDSEPITIGTDQTYTVPDFVLYEDVQNMQEVVVTAKKNFVEQQADKMVINPEASITTASDDVLEVLRKSPGIIIDNDDNITLKNKQVKVMIDNRPTYMSGEQLAALLRNMQATSIDKIEIIENPPSRYDAEGDAGIINIRTKRGLMRGYNGSLNLGAGYGKKFSDNYGLDLNYRNEKWNIYGNYYGGDRRGWYELDLTQYSEVDGSVQKQYNEQYWRSSYGNAKLGIDYYITPRQVVGVMTRGNFGTNPSAMDGDIDITGSSNELIQQAQSTSDVENKYKNLLVNLNYKWTIDSLGQELSVDADMARYGFNGVSDLYTTYIPPTTPLNMHKEEDGTSNFYSIKADYVLPIGKKARMEAGLKSSWANIDSDLSIIEEDANGNWADPHHLSNRYVYSENIDAVYLSGRYSFSPKTSLQLGLRGEQTIAKGDNKTIDESHTQKYFNLFPSFFLQQQLGEIHQLGLSYSFRIGRPPYDFLNPFIFLLDPYTFSQGNPYLVPQYTHASKLSYTLKNKYILSLDFSYTEDVWVRFFRQEGRRVIATWYNLDDYYNASATLVVPVQITKWWYTNTSIVGLYGQYKSQGEGSTDINKSQYTLRGNTTFTFMLPKNFSAELSGWYTTKGVYGVINFYPQGAMNIGVQKLFANNKASLKLGVSDILKTQKDKYDLQYDNVKAHGMERNDSRRVTLTFTYRFGRNDIKAARQRSTGLEEETSRAK